MYKRIIIALVLCMFSFGIFVYQFKYSESSKIAKNLQDFDKVESFLSSKVSQIDIEKINRENNGYPFIVVDEEDIENFQKFV